MVTSVILDGVMVSTLAWNARDPGVISALGVLFPIFIKPTTHVGMSKTNHPRLIVLLNQLIYPPQYIAIYTGIACLEMPDL